ncbi:MAG: hypothetical protein HQK50_18375 [Oligoflexia bacterium]|nr:hypothetical protein [Oligoflexia bacterium]
MPNRDGTGPWWSNKKCKVMNEKQNELTDPSEKVTSNSDVNREDLDSIDMRRRRMGRCRGRRNHGNGINKGER